MTTVRNLTPHPVVLVDGEATHTIPVDGPPARLVLHPDEPIDQVTVGPLTVPVVRTAASSETTGLPPQEGGVLLIVARAVAEEFPERTDLLFPHRTVRGEGGRVVGCAAFGIASPLVSPAESGDYTSEDDTAAAARLRTAEANLERAKFAAEMAAQNHLAIRLARLGNL
jgi:hypothetical protein